MTFENLSKEWINNNFSIKKSSFSTYTSILNSKINPELGNLNLEEISNETISNFINKSKNNVGRYGLLSNKYQNDIIIVLKSILNYAHMQGYTNVKYRIPLLKASKKEFDFLNFMEQEKLVDYCFSNLGNKETGIILSLFTGARIGEICALRLKDIDLNKEVIHISKTVERIKNSDKNAATKTILIIDTPKSVNSSRDVPIPIFLLPVFKEIKASTNNSNYLLSGTEKIIEPRNLQYFYKKLLQKCGVRYVNFHMLRHLFAVNALRDGWDIQTLSEVLGHSSAKFTLDFYIHSDMEHKKKCMYNSTKKYCSRELILL